MTEFNKNKILPDELFSFDSSLDILKFLKEKNCFLENYEVAKTTFPFLAFEVCQQHNVNIKLLLVSLQREQGLISRSEAPLTRVMERALGFGCTDGGDLKRFYGFELQVRKSMQIYRHWFNFAKDNSAIGRDFIIDQGEDTVHPENAFTFSLYKYTPWAGDTRRGQYSAPFGNYLTWKIWRRWWPEDIIGAPQK